MKIVPVGAELFLCEETDGRTGRRAGGRTDRYDEANNRFLQFFKRDLTLIVLMWRIG